MKSKFGLAIILSAFVMAVSVADEAIAESSPAEVATKWLEAGQESQEAAINAVKVHMADDGLFYRPRYVGFGFTYDNTDETGAMVVATIVPGSPAAQILKIGDEFKSVRGIAVNADNRDSGKLSFRGAPGEEVAAVIKRGDEMLNIAVKRGKIESTVSKADMIEWMASGDADDWGSESFKLHEVVSDGNVAYAWTTIANTDDVSGQMIESHVVTRFVFNDEGKVVAIGNIDESRFVLEQQGYSISR